MRRIPVVLTSLFFVAFAGLNTAHAQNSPGIAPPPPMDPATPSSSNHGQEAGTLKKLDEAEAEDSGRNFEIFWVDGQLGGSYINMRQLSEQSLQIEKAEAGGPMFSLGAGLRFVVLVFGVRAKYNALSSFNMWQLNLEGGFKIPISKFDLLIGAHGGYSFVGSVKDGTVTSSSGSPPVATDEVKIRGLNAGLDLALDYYITKNFSVGAGMFADFLFLGRPPVAKPSGLTAEQAARIDADPLYQQSGSSAGLQFGGGLRLGGHFGF